MINVRIPDAVRDDIRQGVLKVSAAIDEFQPDMLVVLQRTCSMIYQAVPSYRIRCGLPLPLTVYANIGCELQSRWPPDDDDDDEEDDGRWKEALVRLDRTGKKEDIFGWREYEEWLDELYRDGDDHLFRLIHQLQDAARPKRVLIVDEWSYQGGTLYITAPYIVNKAYGDSTEIRLLEMLVHDDSIGAVVRETLGVARQTHVCDVMELLAKGYADDGMGLLVRLSRDNLPMYAARRLHWYSEEHQVKSTAELEQFLETQAPPDLYTLHDAIVTSIRQIGAEM